MKYIYVLPDITNELDMQPSSQEVVINAYKIKFYNLKVKSLGKCKRKWEDNIKNVLK